MKRCPFCAEDIREAAIRCPRCRSDLDRPPRRWPLAAAIGIAAGALFLAVSPETRASAAWSPGALFVSGGDRCPQGATALPPGHPPVERQLPPGHPPLSAGPRLPPGHPPVGSAPQAPRSPSRPGVVIPAPPAAIPSGGGTVAL